MKTGNSKAVIFLAIIGVSLIFSLTHIAAKEAVMKLSPWAVAFYRFIIGSATLFLLMRLTGKKDYHPACGPLAICDTGVSGSPFEPDDIPYRYSIYTCVSPRPHVCHYASVGIASYTLDED